MNRCLLTALTTFLLSGCLPNAETQETGHVDDDVPMIAYLYHGRWIDSNYREIKPDDRIIEKMQARLSALIGEAAPGVGSKWEQDYLEDASNGKFSLNQQWLLSNGALAILLENAPQNVVEEYEWRREVLANKIVSTGKTDRAVLTEDVRSVLVRHEIWDRVVKSKKDNGYVQSCRDREVPIPPPWPSEKWKRQVRKINDKSVDILEFEFLNPSADTAVFAYKDPARPGVCIALPRFDPSNKIISQLGIICQSDKTGNACFWDNTEILSPSSFRPIKGTMPGTDPATDLKLTVEQMANGNTLVENCAECHRGSNVFLIHPGTLLDLPDNEYDTDPERRYMPVSNQKTADGNPKWRNPISSLTLPPIHGDEQACNSCHEIPELTGVYCAAVLSQAIRKTMPVPPSDPNIDRWKTHQGPYARHTRMLKAACLILACGPAPENKILDVCGGIRD